MLTANLIHPEIIHQLARCGHGSRILIADGNYPLAEKTGSAEKIYLGLCPGIPTVTDVLHALHSVCAFEKAEVMLPEDGSTPEIFEEFRRELPGLPLEGLGRFACYDACMKEGALVFAVSTGEKRTYANILLTVGCA